jgi:hypothetical protein
MDGLPGLPTGAGHGSGLDLPRLTAGSTLLAHARNRWLHTTLGIWTSTDPNASGQGVIGAAVSGGRGPDLSPIWSSLDALYSSGSNLSAAYAHDPLGQSDSLGLFIPGIGPLDTLEMGIDIGMLAHELVSEYSANLDFDADWASDWSMGDDMHSRSGVWASAHEEGGESDSAAGSGYAQAGFWKGAARIAGGAGGVVGKFEKHHALPRYIAKWMNQGVSKLIWPLKDDLHRTMKAGGKSVEGLKKSYHKGLDDMLRAAGVPPMTHPNPKAAWPQFIKQAGGHANAKLVVQQVMEAHTRLFCHKNGMTNADEWIAVIRKSW